MSGESFIPPTRGTSVIGNNVVNPSSDSVTIEGSGTTTGTASTNFSNPSSGPFSYGMPPISRPSNSFGASQSFFSNNMEGASSKNPFNFRPRGSNVSNNAPLFGSNHLTSGFGSLVPSSNMFIRAFPSSSRFFSSQIPNINWGHSTTGTDFQSANTMSSIPNIWNSGGSVGGSYFGQPPNIGFPFNNTSNLDSFAQAKLSFLATLNLPDLSKLTNDPVWHIPGCPSILTKLPSDIPKFESKAGEDTANHIMTFHLWCS